MPGAPPGDRLEGLKATFDPHCGCETSAIRWSIFRKSGHRFSVENATKYGI
jgi:hypothetical protein